MSCVERPAHSREDQATAAEARCPTKLAALGFVDSLALSDAARAAVVVAERTLRVTCPECGRNVPFYCTRCMWTPLPLPPPLSLGVRVHIIRHKKEPASKSSAVLLPKLVAEGDLALHEWSNGSSSSLAEAVQQPGTWLLYPRDDAVDAASVDWSTVSQIVLIDSQWSKASAVGSDPCLAALPAMRLTNGPRTCFWRVATRRLDGVEGLLSTAECVRHTLGVRAAALRLGKSEVYQDGDRLDDLLLLFALQLRAVASESKNCCPWCTDADRRLRVDAGHVAAMRRIQGKSLEAG